MKNDKTKSSWNHRVLAHEYKDEVVFQIHEVYYNEEGKPNGSTKDGVIVVGESKKDIAWTLNKMKECLKDPILWAGDRFPEEYKGEEI